MAWSFVSKKKKPIKNSTMFQEYNETFKENNPGIPLKMMGMAIEKDSTCDYNNSQLEDTNIEDKDEIKDDDTFLSWNILSSV